MSDAPVLRLDYVTKRYGQRANAVVALDGVSLEIGAGERVAIVGESGSGKTTIARIVLGLTDATSGRVWLLGRDVTRGTRHDLAWIHRHAQMVFQDPLSSLNPRKTVRQIVRLPLDAQRVGTPATRAARVRALVDAVGLSASHLGAKPAELSGGQRQRVGIARALAIEPRLLVLDEPTSSLDVSVQARVLDLLGRVHAELGVAQLLITHNLGVVRHAADRVAVLYLGAVVEIAPTARIFARPAHPYTRALFSAIPTIDDAELAFLPERVEASGEAVAPGAGCPFQPRCPHAFAACATMPPVTVLAPGHAVRCHLVGADAPAAAAATS